jgi:hypothetical protein
LTVTSFIFAEHQKQYALRYNQMKGILALAFITLSVSFIACSRKNRIAPVTGTIDGKPAVTLYGSSFAPTDYILIDTIVADRKLSYDGIVFSYLYTSDTDIVLINSGTPAAKVTLASVSPKMILKIKAIFTITFGSPLYTSN